MSSSYASGSSGSLDIGLGGLQFVGAFLIEDELVERGWLFVAVVDVFGVRSRGVEAIVRVDIEAEALNFGSDGVQALFEHGVFAHVRPQRWHVLLTVAVVSHA